MESHILTNMSLVQAFFTDKIEVTTYVDSKYVKGVWKKGLETTITVDAFVHPCSGKDLLSLPEGERVKQTLKIYTDEKLKDSDIICIRSEKYKVYNVEDWVGSLPFYHSLGVKIEDNKSKREV